MAAGSRPLETAFTSGGNVFDPPTDGLAAKRVRDAGARALQVSVSWRQVAPTPPADPTNPADPAYDWSAPDQRIRLAVRNGLKPVAQLADTPGWAEQSSGGREGTNAPRPDDFARFALAAARRYSGSFADLPGVRDWAIWNEPNASYFFNPQRSGSQQLSPALYRTLVQQAGQAIKSVRGDSTVAGGELFPFYVQNASAQAIAPLDFLRTLFCLPGGQGSGCYSLPVDVISFHPYTTGGPDTQAAGPTGVSMGDLPEARRVVDQIGSGSLVQGRSSVGFWITEFSWDSSPPDPKGVPYALEARWVAEALNRAWRSGVTRFTWFLLRDDPRESGFDSGLWTRCASGPQCDRPKPALQAFRFPFVAYKATRGRISVWARTPAGSAGKVVVEQRVGKTWVRLAKITTDQYGIFNKTVKGKGSGVLRARFAGESSASFSLKKPKNQFVLPFGS
jgi:hypothetical protein